MGKVPIVRADGVTSSAKRATPTLQGQGGISAAGRLIGLPPLSDPVSNSPNEQYVDPFHSTSTPTLGHMALSSHPIDPTEHSLQRHSHYGIQRHHQQHNPNPSTSMQQHNSADDYIDPQIMEDVRNQLGSFIDDPDPQDSHDPHSTYSNPYHTMLSPHPDENHHGPHQANSSDGVGDGHNTDLDMLIEDDEDEHEGVGFHGGSDAGNAGREENGDELEDIEDHSRVQAQMAARAAEAAMRTAYTGQNDRDGGIYGGEHVYRDG
jgi:hypothetical protein